MTRCGCPKEATSQSVNSPCLVADDEPIVYALVNPLTSSVKDISKSQLKDSKLSVCRAKYIDGPTAKKKTVDVLIANDSTREHEGFLYAFCEEIRAINLGDSSVGAFCVIDDALPDYDAHAHLGFSEPDDSDLKNERVAARGNLLLLFKKRNVRTDWAGDPFPQSQPSPHEAS